MVAGKKSLCMSRIYCKHRNAPNLVILLQGDKQMHIFVDCLNMK